LTRAILFHGGRVHVGDGRSAEALLTRDGVVAAVGSARELRREAQGAELVDLRGGLMVPGWVDAHVHFIWWALQMSELDLRDARTIDDALGAIAARARSLPDGAWLIGGRFDKNNWGAWPDRWQLDRVTAGHPTALRSKDGHSRWVNTAALEVASVTRVTEAPAGGSIFRDGGGEPTGILQENANGLIDAVVPPPTDDQMLDAARLGQREAWKRGVVGFENLDAFRDRYPLGTFQRLHAAGELGLRATIGLPVAKIDEALGLGLRTGFGDDWLRIGHLKIFTDGALGSQTAALDEPYAGSEDRGILTVEPARLNEIVARAAAGGIAVAIHAIGDRAVHVALDAIAPTRRSAPQLRQKVEHVQLVRAEELSRFADLGVIASMQPIHATSDRDLADRYWGPDRVRRAYPWRTFLRSGAVLAFGSDAPVEPIDPLLGIHAAVARRRPGDPDAWTPEQKLTLDESLAGYAAGPAYALGREKAAGTLAVGMQCDATVVDRDLARVPEAEIATSAVRATVTGGVVRYEGGLG
jgi:predicted amidohydrolase YtcJ